MADTIYPRIPQMKRISVMAGWRSAKECAAGQAGSVGAREEDRYACRSQAGSNYFSTVTWVLTELAMKQFSWAA